MPRIEYVDIPIDIRQGCVATPYTFATDIQIKRYLKGTEPRGVCAEPSVPQLIPVPSVVGLPTAEARSSLEGYRFVVTVRKENVAGAEPGTVISQEPGPGVSALQEDTVVITIAAPMDQGPSPIPSPSASAPSPSPSSSP